MGSWDRWTCMHGIREELDYHDCGECQKIARKLELSFEDDMFGGTPSYIFTSQKQVDKLLKEKKEKDNE